MSACRRSTRRSSTISTASRPAVARAIAVSRSSRRSSSSRASGGGAVVTGAGAGEGGGVALKRSAQVEILEVQVVGPRGEAALDENRLVAAALGVVEEVEHRRV